VTFPRYVLVTEPQKKFSHIYYCPPNFGGKQRAPQMAKNWFQAYFGLGVSQMENLTGISMFSYAVKPATLVLTSLDGICKPEIEIRQNRK